MYLRQVTRSDISSSSSRLNSYTLLQCSYVRINIFRIGGRLNELVGTILQLNNVNYLYLNYRGLNLYNNILTNLMDPKMHEK